MSKEERGTYHAARRAHETAKKSNGPAAAEAKPMTKAERKAKQDEQRKAIDEKKHKTGEREQLLADLKLQGLSEDAAMEVLLEMEKNLQPVGEEDDSDEEEGDDDLLGSVQRWVAEQDQTITKDALSDFNMKVRFQGHVDTTPPDHIRALLHVICAQACRECDMKAAKVQPAAVEKRVAPAMARWSPMLVPLYKKIDDVIEGSDAVVQGVQTGMASLEGVSEDAQACGLVGCLMAIREIDLLEDEDLLTGCRRLEPRSKVLDKFTEFLEDELDDEDDDESD